MLKQFTTKGLPKQRFYNLDLENPMSDSYLAGSSPRSVDSLQQFLGFNAPTNEENNIGESRQKDVEFDRLGA